MRTFNIHVKSMGNRECDIRNLPWFFRAIREIWGC
jgi:hypothetical protein